jgi:hypothetical protein
MSVRNQYRNQDQIGRGDNVKSTVRDIKDKSDKIEDHEIEINNFKRLRDK